MEKDELEQRIKELEIELSLLKSGKVESPLLENESSFYNAGADPSEQKKVENVLKESEEKFKLIFEKSIAPIIVADDKGNYLEVNKAAAEIFEYSINELMGMNVGDLITTSNPNAAAQYEEYIRKGEEIGEFGFISKKGTPKIVQYQAVRIKPDCNLSILMDVTSQKQIEDELLKTQERLNAGLKIANIALSEISYITNTVQLSPESAAMYGFPKNQLEATRQQMHDTFHPAIKEELEAQIIIAMNPDSGGHMALEHPIVLPSGEVRWLKVNKQFFYDHSTQPAKPVYSILVSQDITERKESSQYARRLIEASLDPLVTINADGKITDVNEASIKITGVEREKLIDTDFSNYFTEPQKAQEGYQQVFEKGFVADYPLTIKHKNGNLTDVLYNASVYKDDKGNVLGVFAAARDVTEQKQASRYARSLIEASLDPLVTINADGKITDVNEASIKITGVEREKLIDTDFSNYFTEPQKAQEGYQQVFEKGFVADYPLTIKHKNGNLTDVLYNASVYKDDKGNVLGVFAAARDITERKQAEEKIKESEVEVRKIKEQLELSITAGKIGVWHWNVKNDLLYWSKEQHEIYGFNKSETVTSSAQFNALMFSGDLKRIQDDLSASNKLEHEYDFQITRKNDGELRWIKSRAKNTFDSQGVLQYISGVNIDITEQKLFEEKLIEAKTSAENAAKSRQQFLSNMSHEIRTPLNSILGFTNVLLKTELDVQQKEFLDAINTSGKSLNLLINDILDLAKVDAGKMTFETKPFEIRKSITALLHSFDMKIREKNLELVEVYDNKIPPILVGDLLRLNQIILNLISNAVKFTHKGKIKLTIKLLHEDKENVTIEFVVSDSGIGIADNKLNSIFNLFEQAEINTSTSYGGTGLGLSIVKQLVEGQGGSVSVKSKLGEGSVFSVILPFGKANLKLEEEIILLDPVSEIKNPRVLVAEDVPLNQLLIKIILNDFGFEHEIVGNGKLAIEKMQTNTYDIILMDLHMPEVNGFEATEYIRKTLKSYIPIIALTADVTTMDVSKCKEFGMDSYISKPIEEKLLYNKIVELVKKNK